jgi:hypothetical protein
MTQAIGAYAYGFSKTEAAYAYPASMGYFDYERYDEFAPLVNYELDCEGNTYSTKTWVQDKPDIDSTCSRMAYITMNPELSKNYKLTVEPFIPGEKQVVKWGLKVIDPYLNAEAHLTFADRAGNLTRKVITYDPVLLTITPKNMNFGTFKIGENKTIQFTLKNESATRTIELTDLNLRSYNENLEETGFSLDYEFDFSEPLKPGDTRKFEVTFRAKTSGNFFDSIGVGNICLFNYKAVVKADVISEGIKIFVSDLDFGALQVGSVTTKSAIITNGGLDELKITGFTSTSPEFTTNLPKMSSTSPLIIPRDGSYQFNVTFRPTSERTLHDTISFISNAGSNIDPNCSLLAVVSGVDAYVMVLKPSTELQIEAGQVLYLEWKTSEVFPVDIKLFDGNSEERIIAINQLQLTYLWKIPKNLKASKDYKIRIIASYEPDIFGESPIIDINRIDELKYNPNISLSPNPTDGEVFIEANESEIIKEIALTDILGNKIMNWANIQKTSTLLDLSSVPNGKYFLRIRTEKGYKLKTIIVNR